MDSSMKLRLHYSNDDDKDDDPCDDWSGVPIPKPKKDDNKCLQQV